MNMISSGYPELDAASETIRENPRQALEMCDAFAAHNPQNYKLHLTRITAHNRLSNWQGAMHSANDYVQFRSDHPQPFWMRAEAAHRLGMYEQSIADTNQAITLDDDKFLGGMPYRLLAMNHAQMGNLSEALINADNANAIEPKKSFPPIGCLFSGTMPEFKAYLTTTAQQAR